MVRRIVSGVCTSLLAVCFAVPSHAQLSYKTSWTQQLPNAAAGVAPADFNRDGRPDVAVLQGSEVSVFFNLGAGQFGNEHDTPAPSDSYTMQAADVNHDGHIDLMIAEYSTPNILILLGNGDGTFRPPINIGLSGTNGGFALGDFNGDGKLDLAVKECSGSSMPNTCAINVMLGHGDGTFSTSALLAAGSGAQLDNLVATDFNKDGRLDLATAAEKPSRGLVFFGNGNGTFRSPIALKVNNPIPSQSVEGQPNAVAADFNGDGIPDLAVMAGSYCGGSACGQANVTIFLSNGAGGFTMKTEFQNNDAFGPEYMRASDLNNDLRQDVVGFNGSPWVGEVDGWLGTGSGTFGGMNALYRGTPSDAQFRDMNLDGRHDFVVGDWMSPQIQVNLDQNGTPNCAGPPSDMIRAKICSPGASVSSTTFIVKASGNSPVGVKRLELWVDGVKRYQAWNDQLRRTLTLTPGKHRLVVIAVDQYIGSASTAEYINVP